MKTLFITLVLSMLLSISFAQITATTNEVFETNDFTTYITVNVPAQTDVIVKTTKSSRVTMTTTATIYTANQAYKVLAKGNRYKPTATQNMDFLNINLSIKTFLVDKERKIIQERYKVTVYVPEKMAVHINEG